MTQYQKNFLNTYPFSDTGFGGLLAASTALPWTVPGNSNQLYRAKFACSSTAEIWVSYNGTAVIPVSNTATDLYNQELVPLDECRYVKGGDTLSFISTGTPQVSVSLLLLQTVKP